MSAETDGGGDGVAPVAATREEFGRALTEVRQQAGLTVRDVAKAIDVPPATVGGYFSGRHLPPLKMPQLLIDILGACGVSGQEELARWRETLTELRRSPGRPAGVTPYVGLAAFDLHDAEWFFGRARLTERLCDAARERLLDPGPLLVIGASGAGKSSLLRAGLLAALRRGELAGGASAAWPQVIITPGEHPAVTLRQRLDALPGGQRAVLVVDQLEEVFSPDVDATEREEFITGLAEAAQRSPESGVLVVLGLRADFYSEALASPAMLPLLSREPIPLGAMSGDELREVILGPATAGGFQVEPALVELLLLDLATPGELGYEAGALPLLSHALLATWQRSSNRNLTVGDYLASGGIRGAVAHSAEAVYEALSAAQREITQNLFLRLVHVDEHAATTRRHAPRDELRTAGADEDDARNAEVADRFTAARLLTGDAETVAITHEALISAWPRLRGWIDADRDGLRIHRRLSAAAEAWLQAGRDPQLLSRGSLLAAAEDWQAQQARVLTPPEREFLSASARERDRARLLERRRTRRLARLVAALLVLLLVAAGLTGFVVHQRGTARAQRASAVSRQVATGADTLRGENTSLADQLAVAAYRTAPTPQATASLLDSSASPMATRLLGPTGVLEALAVGGNGRVLASATHSAVQLWSLARRSHPRRLGPSLPAGRGTVFSLAINPSRPVLMAAGAGGRIRRWDISDATHPRPLPSLHAGHSTVYSLALDPGKHLLAAARSDGRVETWRLPRRGKPQPLATLRGAHDAVESVAISPDGRTLAAGSADRHVYRWNLTHPRNPHSLGTPLSGFHGKVYDLAYSPDGKTLAAGSADKTVRVWTVSAAHGPKLRAKLTGFSNRVNTVAFSARGHTLAAGSSDNTVRRWDLESLRPLGTLGHPGPVTDLAYLPGGAGLLSADADGSARLWPRPGPVTAAGDPVFDAPFTPDGKRLLLAGDGKNATMQLRAARGSHAPSVAVPAPAGHRFSGSAALSPDGRTVAAGYADGSIQLYDAGLHPRSRPTKVAGDLIEHVAFSPDGHTLAAASDDHTVRLLEVSDPAHPHPLARLHKAGNYVFGTAFSRRGHLLATASADKRARIWDVADPTHPKLLARLHKAASYDYAVAFDPRGGALAVGSADHTVRLWNTRTPSRPRLLSTLRGPTNYVDALAFSPGGHQLAAGSTDHRVWLWNVTDPRRPAHRATLAAATDSVFSVAFSPHGSRLAAGDASGAVHVWDTHPQQATAAVCARAGTPITRAEWSRHVSGLPYDPPCG